MQAHAETAEYAEKRAGLSMSSLRLCARFLSVRVEEKLTRLDGARRSQRREGKTADLRFEFISACSAVSA